MDKAEEVLISIAALMHDVGKCTNVFQEKLQAAINPSKSDRKFGADPVRHEVFSAFFFDALCCGLQVDDHHGLARRISKAANDSSMFDKAAKSAEKACLLLAKSGSDVSAIEFSMDISDPEKALSGVLMLILTHHRLFETNANYSEIQARYHANFDASWSRHDFKIATGHEIWNNDVWMSDLQKAGRALDYLPDAQLIRGEIYARTALMLADHVGSNEKKPSTDVKSSLANTTKDTDGITCAADSVPTHTRRVAQASKPAIRMLQGQTNSFPSLDRQTCPETIVNPGPTPDRFSWQGSAAQEAARVARSTPGGFFGCILAGTGTGKTRAAPTIMASAAFSDPNPDRRGLRYNLALGLRTLAHQSANEYVKELGFSPDDISVLVGGETINWDEHGASSEIDKISSEESGSEDRLEAISEVRAEKPDALADDADLLALGLDCDRHLPAFAERVVDASNTSAGNLNKLLVSPLVVSTIDHLMPAADARRSWHLPAMLRIATSDLIIDEIDQFSEEDLMAIERLVEAVAAFGRRLIIMSATLPQDIANQMYNAYRRGYSDYSRRTGDRNYVHVLLAGDAPNSQVAATDPDFENMYDQVASSICQHLKNSPALRKAQIMPLAQDWDDLAQKVLLETACYHRRLADNTEDGFFISVGIVRMTRVKHVQKLATSISKDIDDEIHREYVIVHSRMPQVQRSWIEHNLRIALIRKGSSPNGGLVSLLKKEGVFQRARDAGKKNISLIVISSPVIETGNDIDFDYGIIDPSSARAIIQTAGRIRRHRAAHADPRNISILGEYCVSKFETGRAENPGVESKLSPWITPVTLDDLASRKACDLLGQWKDEPIDASLMLSKIPRSPLIIKEADLRRNFRNSPAATANRERLLARWAAKRPLDLRFRRSKPGETTAFPTFVGGDNISWWEFSGYRGKIRTEVKIYQGDSIAQIPVLLTPGLKDLLTRKHDDSDLHRMMTIGSLTFFPDTGSSKHAIFLDPILGAMKPRT